MSNAACELAELRAALAAAEARAEAAESELERARATVTCSEAMIQELKLEIARLRRDKYGISSERRARPIEQLELQLEELETAATEDALAAAEKSAKAMYAMIAPGMVVIRQRRSFASPGIARRAIPISTSPAGKACCKLMPMGDTMICIAKTAIREP